MVRIGSNFPAESRQGCPVREDRSGPGNNKSIYESKTGRKRRGVLLCSFPLPSVRSEPSYAIVIIMRIVRCCPAVGERSKKCQNCYGCYAYRRSFPNHSFSIWGKSQTCPFSSDSCLFSFCAHRWLPQFRVKLSIIDWGKCNVTLSTLWARLPSAMLLHKDSCIPYKLFTVQLDKVRTPGRDTLNVSVPLPDSRFKTLSFHLSLLQLCGRTACRMHVCLMCTSWMVSMAARYLTSQCVENWVCFLVNIHHWSQREYWTLIWFWRLMLYQR